MPSEQTQFKPGVTKLPKTKGRFSKQEMEFIDANIKTLGLRQTARKMRRNEPAVKRAAIELGIKIDDAYTADDMAQQEIEKELRGTHEYRNLRAELTKKELRFFAHRYSKHLAQFREDTTTTEQTQIFQAIKFEIMMNRHGVEIKKCMRDKVRLEALLHRFWQKYKDQDVDDASMQILRDLENNLAAIRAAEGSRQNELIKCQEKHSDLLKSLKSTRDQRLARADTVTTNITDIIKKLREQEFRDEEGVTLELVKKAVATEAARLGSLHTYVDGQVDLPILNHETVAKIVVEKEENI